MAPPSPRRSSRARGNTITQSQQTSSTPSLSSRGGERSTRSFNKAASSKSTPTSSLSSDNPEDAEEGILNRRRTRGQDESRERLKVEPDTMPVDEEIQEDDESVRCVCGFEEYPGPPPFDDDAKHGKHSAEADFFASIELSDEVSGLFVQCDVCKVWQHGACVGIFTEESSPDEYFCEKCRKDLHKIHAASNGQRYSNYLPLGRPSRANSRAGSMAKDGTKSPKEAPPKNSRAAAAAAAAAHASKRRSTMNSRDAAYDEEELLRRAIEASKEEHTPELGDTGIRRTKRGRSDSAEHPVNLKRQRTGSPSTTPPPEKTVAVEDDSEEEAATRNGSKKARNGRQQREKSEREERDRQRAENANKRKGRADRRRAEDSSPAEEPPQTTTRAAVKESAEPQEQAEPTIPSAPTPDPTPSNPAPTGSTHKKSARGQHKRGKGRNQYTKDRDDHDGSPARSVSRDVTKQPEDHNGGGSSKSNGHGSKSKAQLHSKISMSDMKRRVSAFLDFISKTQIEMAGESSSGSRGSQNSSMQQSPHATAGNTTPKTHEEQTKEGTKGPQAANGSGAGGDALPADPRTQGQDFKELNCVEMMDVLTRDLVKWQNQYSA